MYGIREKFVMLFCALLLSFVLSSAANAASNLSEDGSVLIPDKAGDREFTKSIPGGIELTFLSIRKHEQDFIASFTVKTSKDTLFSVEAANSAFKDARDETINWNLWDGRGDDTKKRNGYGVYIDGKQLDSAEAKAGKTYQLEIHFWVKREYTLTPIFPYVGISVNGLLIEFIDVPIAR